MSGWWRLPHEAFDLAESHGPLVFTVLAYLESCSDQHGCSFPTRDTIARRIGSSKSSVTRALKQLVAMRVIAIEREAHQANRYRILKYRASVTVTPATPEQVSQRHLASVTVTPEQVSQCAPNKNHGTRTKNKSAHPSVEEVAAYCRERSNGIDGQHFVDYHQARGWKYGPGKPVVDWKAAVRTWERRDRNGHGDEDGKPHAPTLIEGLELET